jgi:hypothetical protein
MLYLTVQFYCTNFVNIAVMNEEMSTVQISCDRQLIDCSNSIISNSEVGRWVGSYRLMRSCN